MKKILIVEDEKNIAEMMRLCLVKNGYSCVIAGDGKAAADIVEKQMFDLVLLDVMLPGIDGFELIPYIKMFDMPVIFVTARISVEDRVKGLKLGADDYILKPFDLNELLARIEAVLRRYSPEEAEIYFRNIKIDTRARSVYLNGVPVPLSVKEYELLLYFLMNKNIALYREKIYEHVWREPYMGNTRTIDLHVQRLKKKLELGDAIRSIYKIGYLFAE